MCMMNVFEALKIAYTCNNIAHQDLFASHTYVLGVG